MSREIKFKGKRIDNGEWVYGCLVKDPQGKSRIYWKPFDKATSNTYHFVILESVGQFTGLKDKNGVDGYEGDKVILQYGRHHTAPNGKVREGIIKFDKKLAAFVIAIINSKVIIPFSIVIDFQVIGNIHENK